MIQEAIKTLVHLQDLTPAQMQEAMHEIMNGRVQTNEIVAFLQALSEKGESVEELTAAATVMREYAVKISSDSEVLLDTCGTGGDVKGTFNISTAVAFVASACGAKVAKHGNRLVSSACGSADILEALGINIQMSASTISRCLDEIGIAFLFAQNMHPSMKYAMPARKQIGKRTIFNLLGPLTNPAGAKHQLIGVFDLRWEEPLAQVLVNLGSTHVMVVHGEDGLDEVTTTGKTYVCEVYKGALNSYTIAPGEFKIKQATLKDLAGGSIADNANILMDVLCGKPGPARDIVILNAAMAVYVADLAWSMQDGIVMSTKAIDSGEALEKLTLLRERSNDEQKT